MSTLVNYAFFLLLLVLAVIFLIWSINGRKMDSGARIIVTSLGFLCWLGIGFWLLDGSVFESWGLTEDDMLYTFLQWLPFFICMVPIVITINYWNQVEITRRNGDGSSYKDFVDREGLGGESEESAYDKYKEQLRALKSKRR